MICAYDENLLYKAQTTLAHMLDCAVNLYGYKLSEYYDLFLHSQYASRFENGESSVIAGMSGHELAYCVINDHKEIPLKDNRYAVDRTPEYWTGWSLAYYQWYSSRSFRYINEFAPIEDVFSIYSKYHEMDILHFVEYLNEKEACYSQKFSL